MRALDGVVVLDLTRVLAGPYGTMLLGDMGATVVKIEPPWGDETRRTPPFKAGASVPFELVNRNKDGVILDLDHRAGAAAFRRLAASADVVVENYRPGTMERLGLGWDTLRALNPRLVMASVSGFGQTGPYARRGGYDLVTQAMSGIMSVTGEAAGPPVKCGLPITDLCAGLFMVQGVLLALFHRTRTGEGQYVDTSLFEAGVALSVWQAAEYWGQGTVPGRLGSGHPLVAPYEALATRDEHIIVGAQTERLWPSFCEVIGRPDLADDPRFAGIAARVRHRAELRKELEQALATHEASYWLERLEQAGIPAAPILGYDAVYADPQALARGMVIASADGTTPLVGNPLKMSRTPWQLRKRAPALGEDTDDVLQRSGFTPTDIDALRRLGVLDRRDKPCADPVDPRSRS
ncbi:MAG: CoA transferase [Candidatus Rokubacteria bacterium]|nr:CoA transferase [Candidatus Rokubacteria bacterium]